MGEKIINSPILNIEELVIGKSQGIDIPNIQSPTSGRVIKYY